MKPDPSTQLPNRTDSELDGELQALLGVEHSPEFVARVRNAVEGAPAPGWRLGGRFGWTVFAAGAMAAAIILAVVLTRPHELIQPIPEPLPETSMLVPPAVVRSANPPAPTVKSAKPAAKEPEFFISRGEAEAIQHFLRVGAPPQVEISIVNIEPQPLPETPVAQISSISLFEQFPKGDIQ